MEADYGEIYVNEIKNGLYFWILFDELISDEGRGIGIPRTHMVQSYRSGNLFGLFVHETDSMFQRRAQNDPLFCREAGYGYLLPCFCIKNGSTAEILWVHSRARRCGIGKKLVELLKIDKAWNPLKEAIPFWKACGIEFVSHSQT